MIYTFAHADYLLSVKKVRQTEAPGCGKIARLIKVDFEIYRLDEEHKVVRCDEERIAQHVYLTLSEGHFWQTQDDHDSRFLEAARAPADVGSQRGPRERVNRSVDQGPPRSARSRWIQSSRGIQGDSIPGAGGVPPRPPSLRSCVDFGGLVGGFVGLC